VKENSDYMMMLQLRHTPNLFSLVPLIVVGVFGLLNAPAGSGVPAGSGESANALN